MLFRNLTLGTIALVITLLTPHASGQLYYLPIEVDLPSAVNPVRIESMAVGDGSFYIGSTGSATEPGFTQPGVYEFDSITYDYIRTYQSPNAPDLDRFGKSIQYYDGQLLVGAPAAVIEGLLVGAAYLIDPIWGTIIQDFDPLNGPRPASAFGWDVSFNDVATIIGAWGSSSSGKVFAYDAANNQLITTLSPDPTKGDTAYGFQVQHNDDYLVVSAPGLSDGQTGAVYVYDFMSGELLHRLTSPGTSPESKVSFGTSIDLDGDTLVVGSLSIDFVPPDGRKVYVFDLSTGDVSAVLEGVGGHRFDQFGRDVSIEGNLVVVGAVRDYEAPGGFLGNYKGAVYIFDLNTNELVDKVFLPNSEDYRIFGWRVKIQNGMILALAEVEDGLFSENSVFTLNPFCRADVNLDGGVDFFDVSDFLKYSIDFNNDGDFDFFDVSDFLTSFQDSCS